MSSLSVPRAKTRARALSVNKTNEAQRSKMEQSLDDLQSTLSEVEFSWRQTVGDDANPLDIALPLLDNTSVGLAHRHGEFLDLKDRISNGLRQAVNEHFQAFNDSVGSYRSVVQNIANSQHTLNRIKETIQHSTNDITGAGDSLNDLNENLKNYNDMIEVLSNIEYLKKAPNDLEDAISDKNYANAQVILHTVSSKAQTYRLWELPALSNLESYFQTQHQQLFEILIEEIHNIIYSKKLFDSFNSGKDDFRDLESSKYSNVEKHLMSTIDTDILETSTSSHSNVDLFMKSLYNNSPSVINSSESIHESNIDDDADRANILSLNDSNPFNQLLQLFSIIYRLGKLPTAIEIIIQRNANEINQLVNRQTEDIRLRHTKIIKFLNSSVNSEHLSKGLGADQSQDNDNLKTIVIRDLFWSLFKKLLFLLQSVRVISEIVRSFENGGLQLSRTNSRTINEDTLLKLWVSLKSEIKNFVLSYISNNDLSLGSKLTHTSSSIGGGSTTNAMSINKNDTSLFQFYKVDYDKNHSNDLKLVLQDLFPGFINSNDMAKIDSPYIEDTKFLRQARIIPANIFHMRIILEPFLTFIQGSKLLMPSEDKDEPITFFNQFMNSDFLPLLEESFITYYVEEVEEIDPYDIFDPIDERSALIPYDEVIEDEKKIFRFFLEFKKYFSDICFILNTGLQFKKEFTSIIFKLLNKFQDKVEEFSNELLSELTNYLEPNREIIRSLQDPKAQISSQALSHINKTELKRLKLHEYFKVLNNSLKFLINWLENGLIKKIDLNKTDLNLSTIEKLRKNWSFFETTNLKSNFSSIHGSSSSSSYQLDLKHSIKVILDDKLIDSYKEILQQYKGIDKSVNNVLNRYEQLIKP